jgi:pyridoxal phosphate enzyme (YggS family)
MTIAQNLAQIHERIAQAARRAGRSPDEVQLMAVSKTVPPELIREACAAGHHLFGENRVQEFISKIGDLSGLELTWHFIGHLQSNKAAKAVEVFDAVDSLDSLRLAERLNAAAEQQGRTLPVLIELNLGEEQSKAGLPPESPALEQILQAAERLGHIQITGLMTVPPYSENPEHARPHFGRLREIRDAIASRNLPRVLMDQLSMGMSHDFEVAIEEGSTCVRLGTAIFGERQKLEP